MAFRNPTTSRQAVTPSWYGPILSKNTKLGQPLAAFSPTAQRNIATPGPIFPSPLSYQAVIISSLNMLFGTRPGERLWNPSYGLNLDRMVFEPLDGQTMQESQSQIQNAISSWEPRVSVLQVLINQSPSQQQISQGQVALVANNTTDLNVDNDQVSLSVQIVLQLKGAPPDDVWTYSLSYTPPA